MKPPKKPIPNKPDDSYFPEAMPPPEDHPNCRCVVLNEQVDWRLDIVRRMDDVFGPTAPKLPEVR